MDESPLGWLLAGLLVGGIGGAFVYAAETTVPMLIGYGLLTVGGLVVQVSVIALGVAWGLRRHVQHLED